MSKSTAASRALGLRRSHNAIATELLDAGCARWPDLPSRTLARMLFKANKGVFTSIEGARQGVLYRRGRSKQKVALRSASSRCNSQPGTSPSTPWNPQSLPRSSEKPFLPHRVSVDRDTRALILGDIHLPFHNLPALTAAIEEGRRRDCRILILNGDTLDFYHLSRFQKDPRVRRPKHEIALGNQLLDTLDDAFPKARKIFKLGNHDERYDHYLQANAPELFEVIAEHAGLDKLLELEDRGWEQVGQKRPIYLGKLPLIHGHEYPTPVLGPVNAARGLFLRTKDCAMVNHHHQTSEHTETTIRDEMITTWSVGCLCGLHPEYARFNKWNQGSATVEIDARGHFDVHNFRIHQGKILNAAA